MASLDIPDAKAIMELRHTHELEQSKRLLVHQKEILEKAFKEFDGHSRNIQVTLDEPLNEQLFNLLFEKGYNVRQTSQDKGYLLVITPQSYDRSVRMRPYIHLGALLDPYYWF
jgi:hypothetical protein